MRRGPRSRLWPLVAVLLVAVFVARACDEDHVRNVIADRLERGAEP